MPCLIGVLLAYPNFCQAVTFFLVPICQQYDYFLVCLTCFCVEYFTASVYNYVIETELLVLLVIGAWCFVAVNSVQTAINGTET